MPLYEYRCTNCGAEFEKMMRFSEANQNPPCPHCNSTETQKKLSIFAAQGVGLNSGSFGGGSSCGSSGGFS